MSGASLAHEKDEEDALLQKKIIPETSSVTTAIFAGICYSIASGSLVLLNKHALSHYSFTAPTCLLFFQCALSVILVKLCEVLGLIKVLPLKWDIVKLWLPANLLFVAMIGSSFYALSTVGVGMVSVWKNVSNVVTALGDVFIFGKSYNAAVWATLVMMLFSAVIGASTDSSFNWTGYSWQIANCLFTSAYALTLRWVMDKVALHTPNRKKMDEFSMVFYNNILSLPPIFLLMLLFGELNTLQDQPALQNTSFLLVSGLGGFLGFALSFTSLWFLSQTTATMYSLTGALNKIPVALFGLLVFHEVTNTKNTLSILVGLGAGIIFVFAKSKS